METYRSFGSLHTVEVKSVMSELGERLNACTPSASLAPSLMRGKNTEVVGVAGSRIKRLFAVQKSRHLRCEELFAEGGMTVEYQLAQTFLEIIDRILELEIWRQYPQLVGEKVFVYNDWAIGPEESEKETGDLFNPVEFREPLYAVR